MEPERAGVHVVGREAELIALDEFLASEDGPRALVVQGDAGIGKTTIWEFGIDAARRAGLRVLVARASEPELQLSFVTLADLLEGVETAELARVPGPQLRALEVALLRADPGEAPPDPFAVSAGFTSALRVLAQEQPLLVAVDDVPWLDRASAETLAFSARRLRGRPVRFLLARRPGDLSQLERAFAPPSALEHVQVGPLSLGATRTLLSQRLGLSLPRRLLRRVFESSGGNPLFAVELGRMLAERGIPEIGEELPLPEIADDVFGPRVDGLQEPVRRALLAVALGGSPTRSELLRVADPLAVEDLLSSGLIILDDNRVRASHPLLAAAARRHSSAEGRRELHLELARTVEDETLRARHVALATDGPSEELAATAARAAEGASARGARQDAVELAEHALRLTPLEEPRRSERILTLAGYLHVAWEVERMTDLLTSNLDSLPPGEPRARAWLMLSEGEGVRSLDDMEHCLELALAECPAEPRVRASVLAKKAVTTVYARVERVREAEAWAQEAIEAASKVGPETERPALEALGWARVYGGRPVGDLCDRFQAVSEATPAICDSPELAAVERLVWRGETEAARSTLTRLAAIADEQGDVVSFALLRFILCTLHLRIGEWEAAEHVLNEWAESGDRLFLDSPAYEFCQALLAAGRGLPAVAERWAAETISRARSIGVRLDELEALGARGRADLLCGDAARAVESLRGVWEHTKREGVDDPGAFPVAPDLVEALVELGELEEARAVLERLERLSEEQEHPWGLASAKRCRALLALASGSYDDQAAAMLVEAAEEYGALGLRFDRAHSLLILGRAQRRFKKWAAARRSLEQAVAVFEELGSPGWADQGQAELARVGARRPAPEGSLTETEERVARLAADGLSNKQIAAELFVTVHTVEKHLSRAYAKLGVHSRGQLAQRLPAS